MSDREQEAQPAAWIRGRQWQTDGITEYDEEVVPAGRGKPKGDGWVALYAMAQPPEADEPEHLNPVSQVWFRAGLLACREYMASTVAIESPTVAASIRATWWPTLGPDLGPPRQLRWSELTEGEYGEGSFRVKTKEEVSPTLEALPVALTFLQSHCGWPVPHYSGAAKEESNAD